MLLRNKTIAITGATDGLGHSLAQAFAEKEAKVVVIGKDTEKVKRVSLGINGSIGHVADVRSFQSLKIVSDSIESVDVLINNAGVWLEGDLEESSTENIDKVIDTNLKGVIFSTKAFLPLLRKAGEGHIINISSTSGLRGRESQTVYVASKFGVSGFTESLKIDLADTNIKVSGFYPGGMKTNLFSKSGKSRDNADWMDTEKVAKIIVFMVEQDSSMVLDHVVLNKRKTSITNK